MAAWLRGAPDPDAEQRAADRAAVLNDPRFGATAAARDANLSRAKAVTIGFTSICLPLAYWAAMFPQPYWVGAAAAVLAPLAGLTVIRLFNGLVLWMGTSKVQPQVGLVSMSPLLGIAIGAMTKNRLYDPFTLGIAAGLLGVIVGTVIYTTRLDTSLRQSYAIIGGLSTAAAIFGFGSLLDQTFDEAPSKTYVVQVLDKHETHGRAAADYLDLAGWPGRPTGDFAVDDDMYQTPVGSYVCAHDHRGAFALAWFEISACPAAALPSPAQASTSHDDFTDRLARYYPERAQRMEVEGSAEVECQVSDSLALGQCRPLTETPAGYGFGEAAVRMLQSGHLKLSPKPGEKTFRTRIRFRLKD